MRTPAFDVGPFYLKYIQYFEKCSPHLSNGCLTTDMVMADLETELKINQFRLVVHMYIEVNFKNLKVVAISIQILKSFITLSQSE